MHSAVKESTLKLPAQSSLRKKKSFWAYYSLLISLVVYLLTKKLAEGVRSICDICLWQCCRQTSDWSRVPPTSKLECTKILWLKLARSNLFGRPQRSHVSLSMQMETSSCRLPYPSGHRGYSIVVNNSFQKCDISFEPLGESTRNHKDISMNDSSGKWSLSVQSSEPVPKFDCVLLQGFSSPSGAGYWTSGSHSKARTWHALYSSRGHEKLTYRLFTLDQVCSLSFLI